MPFPVVAIVGRPNVGKSSLFNALAGKRIAIVEPTAGVTRDRVSTVVKSDDGPFELIDTGGIGIDDVDDLTDQIERQIELAINKAHLILFVLDGRSGLAPLDEEVVKRLRTIDKPVLYVINKCDTQEIEQQVADFYRLGGNALVMVSAQQRRGLQELVKAIHGKLPKDIESSPDADVHMKLAIVGRRNTGKSTFINSLAEAERMIVSEVPGTTRDSVDVHFERDGRHFIAIDTAGVRKRKSLANDIEFYSLARAQRSIRRADVVLLVLDASQRISKVDKQLAEYIFEQHKPAIFVVNKWDLLRPRPTGDFTDYLKKIFPNLDYVPIAYITASKGKNVYAVLNLAQSLYKQVIHRVNTGDLNRVIRQAVADNPPPMRFNRRPKINYATQVDANPPTIVLFTNGPELFDLTYRRFLMKTIRDNLPFAEVPLKLYLRKKSQPGGFRSADANEPAMPEKKPVKPTKKKSADKRTAKSGKTVAEPQLWKDL